MKRRTQPAAARRAAGRVALQVWLPQDAAAALAALARARGESKTETIARLIREAT